MKFLRIIFKGMHKQQERTESEQGEAQNQEQQGGEGQQEKTEGEQGKAQNQEQQGGEGQQEKTEGEQGEAQNQEQQGGEGQQEKTEGEQGEAQNQEQQGGEGQQERTESEQGEAQNQEQQGGEGQQEKTEGEQGKAQNQEQQKGEGQQERTESEQGEAQKQEQQGGEGQQEKTEGEENKQENQRKSFKEILKYVPQDENTSKGGGMEILNISDDKNEDVPDSVINVLIQGFLNKTFVKENDLNAQRESIIPTIGDIKWNIPDLIKHKNTKQYNEMLYDKYGYTQENGKDQKIPLAFYFDLSGSMSSYSRMLALIAIKLVQKDVKVIVGSNEYIEYQVNNLPKEFKVENLIQLFDDNIYKENIMKRYPNCFTKINYYVLDKYLIDKKAKRVAIFSDFDPKVSIENLSEKCEIYWFCTEKRNTYKGNENLENFKGHFYIMDNIRTFLTHLKNINNRYYEKMQRNKWEGEER